MIFLDLIENVALLLALAMGYRVLASRVDETTTGYRLATGLLFGAVTLVGMATPVTVSPGVIFDGRSIVLAVAGLVGGVPVVAPAAAMATAYRLWLGGTGTGVGIAVIVEAAVLGVVFYRIRLRRGGSLSPSALWVLGVSVHLVQVLLFLALPRDILSMVWAQLGPVLLLVYPPATVVTARLFLDYQAQYAEYRRSKEGENRYRTIWESIGDAVIAVDREGRVAMLNPQASKLTGWSPEEAAGRAVEDVILLESAATGASVEGCAWTVLRGEECPATHDDSLELVSRDGTRRPVAQSCSAVSDGRGEVSGAILTLRDQSAARASLRALEESRERMDLALHGGDLGTWDWDITTGEMVYNERWAEMLGYTLDEWETRFEAWEGLVHPDDLESVRARLADLLEGTTEAYESEHRLRHRSGRWVWVLDKGRIIERSADGVPLRAAGTHLDVTARNEALEALRRREETLRRRNEALLSLMASGALFGEDLVEALRAITETASTLANAERVSVWWYDDGYTTAQCVDAFRRDRQTHTEGEILDASLFPDYVQAHKEGRAVVVSDVRNDPLTKQFPATFWQTHGIAGHVAAPVWIRGRVGGFLSIEHVGDPRSWAAEDERFAPIMATLVSLCVESSGLVQAEDEARRRLAELERVEAQLRVSLAAADRARRALLSTLEDRQRAQQALRDSESFIRAVMDHLPIGVAVNSVDPTVSFSYMNDNFVRLYRTSREALAGPDAFWEEVYPDPEYRATIKARILADVGSGDPDRMHWKDVPVEREGEPTTYVSVRNTPVPGRLEMISTVWDVTERVQAERALRESEERFRRLAENAPDVIYRLRLVPELQFEYVSPAVTEVTGYTPEEHYADPHLPEKMGLPSEDRPFAQVVENGVVEPLVFQMTRKDGERIWTEVRSVLVRDDQGNPLVLEGIIRDITARIRAEEELRFLAEALEEKVQERTRQLSEANAELESFAYSVSHDLKAPLRAIDGYSAFLEDGEASRLSEEGRRFLTEVRANAKFMGQLIEDLLAFSRVGRALLSVEEVNLASLVEDLVAQERRLAPDRTIELELGDIPPVQADPVLFRQALVNIVANAVKFTRPRDVARIRVHGERDGGMVRLRVQDNGVGFDPDYTHKLFRVFERLHYQEEFEGTGVGLAIVRRIVERHHGTVEIRGVLDEGVTVEMTLPATDDRS